MKYQSQHDLIDPDVPSRDSLFEFEEKDDPDAPNDAYVIGENGNTVRTVDGQADRNTPKGARQWAMPAAFALLSLFVVLTIWNLSSFLQPPPTPPKPTSFQTKQALYLGVMKIDAYRRAHGVTPDSLAGAGLPEDGAYAYRRVTPARYLLSFGGNGSRIEYDSNEPREQFFGSPQDMLTIGGPN